MTTDQSIVLGQSDSPLTERGMAQARALGQSPLLREARFTRYYSSDLGRALRTAQLVMQEMNNEQSIIETLRLEKRLREMAKGAREGFSKSTTYAEALEQRKTKDNNILPIPLRETEDDAWQRMHDFVYELLTNMGNTDDDDDDDDAGQHPPNIFVMSHSGILRVFLKRMIGEDRLYQHPSARFDASGLFYIPNTSVTILEVGWRNEPTTSHTKVRLEHNFDVKLVQLALADHLVGSANNALSFAE